MADTTGPPVQRMIGFWTALALVVGNVIGTGIFLLPATLAPFGWNALYGWLVTIGGGLCLAYVFAGLARGMPRANGPYDYIATAFGAPAGFFVMWSYWVSLWVTNAAIAIGAVAYLTPFAPDFFAWPPAGPLTAIGFVLLFTFVATRGVRSSGNVQLVTSVLKLLPLIAVIVAAILILGRGGGEAAGAVAPAPVSLSGIAGATALALWAMLGFESAAVPAARISTPGRTIPRATMIGTLLVGLIYLLVSSAVLLLLPSAEAAASQAPLADLIGLYWGSEAASLVAAFAAISALGALNGWVLLQAEVPMTLAMRGVFPKAFARLNRQRTPIIAHLLGCALSCVLVATNLSSGMIRIYEFMILLATTATLVLYFVAALGCIELQRRNEIETRPLLLAASIIGLLFALATFYGAGLEATGWGAALLATAIPVYFVMRRADRSSPAPEADPASLPE